jgi:hypothetical protein
MLRVQRSAFLELFGRRGVLRSCACGERGEGCYNDDVFHLARDPSGSISAGKKQFFGGRSRQTRFSPAAQLQSRFD